MIEMKYDYDDNVDHDGLFFLLRSVACVVLTGFALGLRNVVVVHASVCACAREHVLPRRRSLL